MTIFQKLETFVARTFKTTLVVFLNAIRLSPNAQGYINGSVTELLLKEHIEKLGFETKRIREKWEGTKHHHGDFYFRKTGATQWFILESKGVKSNTEKWNKLYNLQPLKRILLTHSEIIHWIDKTKDAGPQIDSWIARELPDLLQASDMYSYEEIRDYLKKPPARETAKLTAMRALANYPRDEIDRMIDERLAYVMSKIRVLDTHFVSGTSGSSERTQATPRKDEFNLVSVDIALRHTEHKFLFANPKHLDSSGKDPNHLQQNYIMGFVFPQAGSALKVDLADEWDDNFESAVQTLSPDDAVREADMQIDNRILHTETEK